MDGKSLNFSLVRNNSNGNPVEFTFNNTYKEIYWN